MCLGRERNRCDRCDGRRVEYRRRVRMLLRSNGAERTAAVDFQLISSVVAIPRRRHTSLPSRRRRRRNISNSRNVTNVTNFTRAFSPSALNVFDFEACSRSDASFSVAPY